MNKAAYSRPSAVAERLVGNPSAGQLLERPVLLTADFAATRMPAGRSVFLSAVSLLTRFCADVSIHVPEGVGRFHDDVRSLVDRIHYAGSISFLSADEVTLDSFAAILNVGTTFNRDLPWTSIACDGWALQVCSLCGPVELGFSRFNPAASLAAASLGATEIFKRLLGVLPQVAPLLGNEMFSLLTYSVDSDPGPPIRSPFRLDCLLAGVGAIGSGIRHVLMELPTEGWLAIVDRQVAGEENWGTYIDLAPTGFLVPKAEIASVGWGSKVNAVPFNIDVADLQRIIGIEIPYPDVTLGALDNIEARHELQQLWPDLAIDGAIGDVTCQVSRHPWGQDTACLYCLFRHLPGEDSAVRASRLTGLSVASANQQEEEVTQADIDAAVGAHKGWLAARKGRQKCSVVREALANELTAGKTSFSPSAPFIACLSGSMVASEFIKYRMGLHSSLDPRFQFNALVGPSSGTMLDQGRRKDCFCVERAAAVLRWREHVAHSKVSSLRRREAIR